jgi:hypothetical protein
MAEISLQYQNNSKDRIEHDENVEKKYLFSLEKELERLKNLSIHDGTTSLKEIEDLEDYINKRKNDNKTDSLDFDQLSSLLELRISNSQMLCDLVYSFFKTISITCQYEQDFHILKKLFNDYKEYPTVRISERNFLVYERNKENEFYDMIEKYGENRCAWEKVISQFTEDKTKEKFSFNHIPKKDCDKPIIIKDSDKMNILFQFPLLEDNKLLRVFQTVLSSKYFRFIDLIDKSKELVFSWELDESGKFAILFMQFYINIY